MAAKKRTKVPSGSRSDVSVMFLAVLLMIVAISRNALWHDDIVLWQDAVRKIPGKARAWNNLGFAYNAVRRYGDAVAALSHAIDLRPDNARGLVNRGLAYSMLGEHDHAIADLDRAIALSPQLEQAYFDRGF